MPTEIVRKARKRREDRLDWEELERAPNTDGMLSYLRPRAVEDAHLPGRNPDSGRMESRDGQPRESLPRESLQPEKVTERDVRPVEGRGDHRDPESDAPPFEEVKRQAGGIDTESRDKQLSGLLRSHIQGSEYIGSYLDSSESIGSDTRYILSGPGGMNTRESLPSDVLRENEKERNSVDVSAQTGSSLEHQPSSEHPTGPTSTLVGIVRTRTVAIPGIGRRRLHRCLAARDAHTPGEQVLLATMFRLAKHGRWGTVEPGGSYLVSVSLTELAEHAAMHHANARINLRSLIAKLALDLVAPENRKQQSARTYRVYTPAQILERRRAAGLEWVVKSRGISFVPLIEVQKVLADELRDHAASEEDAVPLAPMAHPP